MVEKINDEITENKEQPEVQFFQAAKKSKFRGILIKFLVLGIVFAGIAGLMFSPTIVRKPAIYLYPEKEQKIEIKLAKSIKYLTVIPEYHNGWVVLAKPSGVLIDLQPKYTDCSQLPYAKAGFEYSKKACENNAYPYIFWEGVQLTKPLPVIEEGFIVSKEDIENFLYEKAEFLRMTKDEKAEFVSYWAYRMKNTGWDYFRVYFLQNEVVDKYLPLKINPKPKSSNRVEIIIKRAIGDEEIKEQTLVPFSREGYTLVEWGGVIK